MYLQSSCSVYFSSTFGLIFSLFPVRWTKIPSNDNVALARIAQYTTLLFVSPSSYFYKVLLALQTGMLLLSNVVTIA